MTDNNANQEREKKLSIAKKIICGIAKICVGAFFGAVAADVTGRSGASKIEKYIAVAGGTILGSMISDQVSDYVGNGFDQLTSRYDEIEEKIHTEERPN